MANLVTKIRTDKGDLPIDYNALANMPSINNNLLLNGNFNINQRGGASYIQTNTWKYSVDRWRYIGIMTVTPNASGTVTISKQNNSAETYFAQTLEDQYTSGTFTLSFNVKTISGTLSAYVEGSQGNILTVTSAGTYKINSLYGAKGVVFRLDGSTTSVELAWAKLECGDVATLFVPRLKAEELMLCRRYYRSNLVRLVSFQHTNRYAYFAYNFETMRDVPTVSYDGFADTMNHAGTVITNTGVSTGEDSTAERITIKTSFTANDTIATYYYLVSSGRVMLDAEIY